MKRAFFGIATVLLALNAGAQQTQPPAQPAQPSAPTTDATATVALESTPTNPALVSTAKIKDQDSDLVKAAKATLARRQKSKTPVIDNKLVKAASGARVSEPTRPLPPLPRGESAPIVTPSQRTNVPGFDRSDVESQIAKLRTEMRRLQSETLEGPYTETDEGATASKLDKVQKEIDRLQKSLDEHRQP